MSDQKPKTGSFEKIQPLSFLQQISPEYLEYLEGLYQEDHDSVSPDIALFFDALELARQELRSPSTDAPTSSGENQLAEELLVRDLIEAYRMRGHLLASIDPLGLWHSPIDPHLDLSFFNLHRVPKEKLFQSASEVGLPPSALPRIVEHLKNTYSRFVSVEYHYIRDEKVRGWLKKRIEKNQNRTDFAVEEKLNIAKGLYRATIFESFLKTTYLGQKRFSLEGAEAVIPALNHGIDVVADLGAKEVVIGMAHRGRLNVLTNVMKKPYTEVFKEFEGAPLPEMADAMGDVKYHQGYSSDKKTISGKKVHLSLAPNPSHLEWVNPVVGGIARAKQDHKYGEDDNAVVPFLIHGDAAVIGQGVVAETLNLAHLEGYGVGGTVHVVINNQIGFTTLPEDSRSSLYCTDFGKGFQAPIFHVNGDQVEDVVHAIQLACEYRMKFNRDVFVDIWCYRRHGHNEGDEPRFTQPLMYQIIDQHPTSLEIYVNKLKNDKTVQSDQIEPFAEDFKVQLDQKRTEVKEAPEALKADMFRGLWQGFERSNEEKMISQTKAKIDEEKFDLIVEKLHWTPANFNPMPKFKKMMESRLKKIKEKNEIDWAVGEQLAFGSLLMDGIPVRLSGQDAVRGTFSQRHSAVRENKTGERHYFLRHLSENQAEFNVFDSPLSEAAVLGFDYGYSMAQPKSLVMWEAQFGDFANSAQVIIDQFITSAESKWYRMSGLVLLLPHGYEGQGPEHSSARLERFLQLSAQNNIQVCYPTTPAQYCHMLRRQVLRKFRKPLIVMTPKSPLRMPEVVSRKEDFIDGQFHTVLVDQELEIKKPERVILCSGKVYWDLKKKAFEEKLDKRNVFIRLEQIYPLDKPQMKFLFEKYKDADRWIWLQEEPKNMGAWSFTKLNFIDLGIPLQYVGRPPAASPATGSNDRHQKEQTQLILEALGL